MTFFKQSRRSAAICLTIGVVALFSCKKDKDEDEGKLPNIAFKTDAGYLSKDTTVAKSTALLLGVRVSKAEANDPLTKLTCTRRINGGTDTVLRADTLTGAQGDQFDRDVPVVTGTTAGVETYSFTVINRDGLTNKVSLNVTVQ